MNELIKITTGEQGSSVVSARELYTFLEAKARFNDWFTRRVVKYGFKEDTDFTEVEGVLLNSEYNSTGRPQTDYALTLDMAKQLAMVENSEKGMQARRYFIDCERVALELVKQQPTLPAPSQTEQMMLTLMQQQAQLMSGQQLLLEQLRADVNAIQAGQRPATKRIAGAAPAPHLSTRSALRRKVNVYCDRYQAQQTEAYSYLYKRMFEVFGISVYRLSKKSYENILDAIEQHGYLDKLHSLVESELVVIDE